MKRIFLSMMALLTVFVFAGASARAEAVQERTLQGQGVILKGSSLIPAAEFMKAAGGQLSVSKTNEIEISYKGTTVQSKLNSKYAKVNGVGTSYAVPAQNINGKLMVPLQMVKDATKGKTSVEYGDRDYGDRFVKTVTVSLQNVRIHVGINDLYESYAKYIGKTAWLFDPGLIYDLYGNLVNEQVEHLAAVKITNVERDSLLDSYVNVYFFYKGRTLKANLPEYDFASSFLTTSPYATYHFSQETWNKIKNRTISIGMTADMVYLSWGPYSRNSRDIYSWGTTDMWVYEHSYGSDDYLFFQNDILTSISR
ncbi:stalk domain-containing protein [Paenibacillus sp. FSL W8-0194]|uniref:stalk domain-containing protein n=1 Tax=Paenibacillus sp. FSL W8-0194 TaxID=2921711 RepID=UPI0030DCF22D